MKNIWSLAHLKFSLKFFAQFNWRDNTPLIVASALSMQGIAWYMLPNSKIIFRKMIDATLFVAYKTSFSFTVDPTDQVSFVIWIENYLRIKQRKMSKLQIFYYKIDLNICLSCERKSNST